MDLSEIRKQLDECDGEIVKLFEKRMQLSEEVAASKLESGKGVLDKDREKEKLAKVSSMVSGELNEEGVKELFRLLMSMSRKLQYKLLTESGVQGRLPFIGVDELEICDASTGTKLSRRPSNAAFTASVSFFLMKPWSM